MREVSLLDRPRLRGRLETMRPSIVALFAPAGYGKSTLIAQTYGNGDDILACDCGGIRDDLDLARRLVPEMSEILADGSRTANERLDLALERFAQTNHRVVVFDRAHELARRPDAWEFFVRALNRRPSASTVVLSSRETLPLRLTRFAAPHDILVLRADDLSFDEAEMRQMLSPYVHQASTLSRIFELSQGWPIALFVFLRFAREGRLHELLDRPQDPAFVALHEYVNDEVLSALDAPASQALFVCAAIPDATDADVRDLFPDALSGDALASFCKDSPFLRRGSDGVYAIHPLLGSIVLEHREQRQGLVLAQLAMQRSAEGNYVRAAELHLASGDLDAAAWALAQHDVLGEIRPSRRYVRVLRRLRRADVQRYPLLWGISALLRLFTEPLQTTLDEAQSMWRTIPAHAALRERYPLFVLRVVLLGFLGRLDEGVALVDQMARTTRSVKFQAYLSALRAFLRARGGALSIAQHEIEEAMTMQGDAMASFAYMTLASEIARPLGDRTAFQLLELGTERAAASGASSARALLAAQLVVSAWFTGNDERLPTAAADLGAFVEKGYIGFAYLAGAAAGREARPSSIDLPEFVVYGHLLELSAARDEERRKELAHAAYATASALGVAFPFILAALAVALTDDAQFEAYVAIAAERARMVESGELRAAVEAIARRDGEHGMLAQFVARIARDPVHVNPPIEVSLASCDVRVDGRAVDVSGRELELLLAIALRRQATPRARLAAILWPDLDEDAARNAFSVCLHRLRARLQRKDAIEREGEGYRLHAHAVVDLWELERVRERPRTKGRLGDRDRAMLERLWHQLMREPSISTDRWEWFEPIARGLRESRTTLAHLLGEDALAAGHTAAATRYADDVLAEDPCDEQAAEIGIRAHLAAGDRAAAMRRYRHYRSALQHELGAEPSFALTALVTTS